MLTLRNSYPYVADGRFDEAYFINHHIPLAREIMAPEATHVRVLRPVALAGQAQTVRIIVEIEFPSRAAMDRAFASSRMDELAADVANYSDVRGIITVMDDSR
jgi:uncharacterized protein (TIGR02118 family)